MTTRVFQSGNSQAVRIPKELRTEKSEFYISRVGDAYVPFTAQDAVATGRIRAELVKTGRQIGAYDIRIAGQGVARGITVVRHNTGEFSRGTGIKLEDWVIQAWSSFISWHLCFPHGFFSGHLPCTHPGPASSKDSTGSFPVAFTVPCAVQS